MFKNFKEIKLNFLDFFKSKDHIVLDGSSLVPSENDKSLLFTNAGMNQFKDFFLGKKKIIYDKVVSIQKCLRISGKHNDFNNIGYTNRHNTFFEMMGNFSFNSYYKEEAIIYAWELLTSKKWFNIPKENLFVTVHISDIYSYNIWSNIIKIPKYRILVLGKSNKLNVNSLNEDNFWMMSKFGPCGTSTEIFYNYLNTDKIINFDLNLKKNNYLEIWNIVFIEYNFCSDNILVNLFNKFVDTGIGLERISSVIQKVNSIFKIDIFTNIISIILYEFKIKLNNFNKNFIYIISDHVRSIFYLIIEGIVPSSDYRGYVLRKLIRNVLVYIKLIKIKKIYLFSLFKSLITNLPDIFVLNNLSIYNINYIKNIIDNEEKKFFVSLENSINILNNYLLKLDNKNYLDGKLVFLLYDTFGLSLNLIVELCKLRNIKVDINKFKYLLEIQKKKSKLTKLINFSNLNLNKNKYIFNTKFYGYSDLLELDSIIKNIYVNDNEVNKIDSNFKNCSIVLNKTIFFPESGGQVGDKGFFVGLNNSFKFIVENTKIFNSCIFHIGYVEYGLLKINDIVKIMYDIKNRIRLSCNHSSVHLLYYSLKKNLGKNITKEGSRIKDFLITFDFSYNKKLSIKQIFDIESLVNNIISKNLLMIENIFKKSPSLNDDNKFIIFNDEFIRKIKFGNFSEENCCGTHVKNTSVIGLFAIINEYSLSNNIRRIEAVSYDSAFKFINNQRNILNKISNLLLVNNKELYNRILLLIKKCKILKNKNKDINNLCLSYFLNFFSLKDIIKYKNINFLIKNLNINLDDNFSYFFLKYLLNYWKLSFLIITVISNKKKNILIFFDKNLKIDLNNFLKVIIDMINIFTKIKLIIKRNIFLTKIILENYQFCIDKYKFIENIKLYFSNVYF